MGNLLPAMARVHIATFSMQPFANLAVSELNEAGIAATYETEGIWGVFGTPTMVKVFVMDPKQLGDPDVISAIESVCSAGDLTPLNEYLKKGD